MWFSLPVQVSTCSRWARSGRKKKAACRRSSRLLFFTTSSSAVFLYHSNYTLLPLKTEKWN